MTANLQFLGIGRTPNQARIPSFLGLVCNIGNETLNYCPLQYLKVYFQIILTETPEYES